MKNTCIPLDCTLNRFFSESAPCPIPIWTTPNQTNYTGHYHLSSNFNMNWLCLKIFANWMSCVITLLQLLPQSPSLCKGYMFLKSINKTPFWALYIIWTLSVIVMVLVYYSQKTEIMTNNLDASVLIHLPHVLLAVPFVTLTLPFNLTLTAWSRIWGFEWLIFYIRYGGSCYHPRI